MAIAVALVGKNEIKLAVSLDVFRNTATVNCSPYSHLDKCQNMFGL